MSVVNLTSRIKKSDFKHRIKLGGILEQKFVKSCSECHHTEPRTFAEPICKTNSGIYVHVGGWEIPQIVVLDGENRVQ
jgi:hypothetical protein